MKELRLNYTDEYGDAKRVAVNDELFTIGRHPENDLCIPDHRLSREHLRIENYSDKYYASDSGSSNGTTLNGAPLKSSVALKNGDRLNLGGAVEIRVETDAENYNSYQSPAVEEPFSASETGAFSPNIETPHQVESSSAAVKSGGSGGISTILFVLAPVLGVFILLILAGLFYAFSSKKEVVQNDDVPIYTPKTRPSKTDETDDSTPTPRKTDAPTNSSGGTSSPPDSNNSVPTLPKASGDAEKVEQNASSFLRRIAQNDPRPYLTGKQVEAINSKISQFKGSSALAENLKAVKKNAAQFEMLANSKNLKPQFLAAAALAKIGNNRGDPLAVANTMLPSLTDLKVTLDNKLADDNLMIIAAYERGAAGQVRSLQSALEGLAKKTPNVSPREIRTIWFLKSVDKITDPEYNFALQFIAIGAIMQNPKDFNVNTDAVTFN